MHCYSSITRNRGFRHADEFLRLRCAPELLEMRLFPNGKEITESMSAYNAARKYISCLPGFALNDPGVSVVCVGDGHQPRTAALFAMRTAWSVCSVDPLLTVAESNQQTTIRGITVKRLTVMQKAIENCGLDFTGKKLVIVSVHSHATNRQVAEGIKFDVAHSVNIPCCVHQPPTSDECVTYNDDALWSPKNSVTVSFSSKKDHKGWR